MKDRTVFVSELGTLEIDNEKTEVVRGELNFRKIIQEAVNGLEDSLNVFDHNFRDGIMIGLEQLLKTHGNNQIYLDSVCENIRDLWNKKAHFPMIMYYLEMLRWLPADNAKLNILVKKLILNGDEQPDRNVWSKIRSLAKLQPQSIDLAVWLVEVIDKAGVVMAEAVMSYRDQFTDSPMLAYYFTEIAKLGSLETIHRLPSLLDYFKDSHSNVHKDMQIILTMIEAGKKVEAVSTISAMEELHTRPANYNPELSN